jgi:hypothetical protein
VTKLEDDVRAVMMTWPGKRGIDIPADVFDQIHEHASGATLPVWGRHPTPEQLQHLYDNGHHDAQSIHSFYADMPHPHADGLKVGEYGKWKQAATTWKQHTKK